MIETRWLYSFLALCQEQSFTKAAASLHISQPALSKQIVLLEEELHTKLLHHSRKGVFLTEEGSLFRTKAREIVQMLEMAESSFRFQEDLYLEGDLSFGCSCAYVLFKLMPLFSMLRKQYPFLRIHLDSSQERSLMEKLENHTLDAICTFSPLQNPLYESMDLTQTCKAGMLCHHKDPLALKAELHLCDLENMQLLVPSLIRQNSTLHSLLPDSVAEIGTYEYLQEAFMMVKAGMGSALCILANCRLLYEDLCFIPIADWPVMTYSIRYHAYLPKSFGLKAFLEAISEINNVTK